MLPYIYLRLELGNHLIVSVHMHVRGHCLCYMHFQPLAFYLPLTERAGNRQAAVIRAVATRPEGRQYG